MDLYTETAYELSKQLTLRYSTSFSMSSKLFSKDIQPDIYAIYGLVRIADEIVDTYKKTDSAERLLELEQETYRAIKSGYSTNPIVHSFALTVARYSIHKDLIKAFFKSMAMDLTPQTYTPKSYEAYIYGSAEVIGLMCLSVFTQGDKKLYDKLSTGACALGSAYQKVNFLRDIASDYNERGRLYFPGVSYETFNASDKDAIIQDIEHDFAKARPYLNQLPSSCRKATLLSYSYYSDLLNKLKRVPAESLKTDRVRLPNWRKVSLLLQINAGMGTK